ncbi:MAG: hypothetical protein P4L20_19555 [Acidimicrobiales bacterium]|nr:hypothetical protein [Acidimicrobiales bacterium]
MHLVEVGVVAEGGDRVPDGRVDRAAGALGRIEGHPECLEEQLAHLDGTAGVGMHHLELRVLAEAAARQVERLELCGKHALGGVRRCRVLHDDGCRGADGPEGAGGEHGLVSVGRAGHRDDPPDVTVGVDWLIEGDDDELPVLPVFPVLPVLLDEDEEDPLPALVETEPDDPEVVAPAPLPVLPAPG